MMKEQISFTEIEYGQRRITTKREAFLKEMDALIPWQECAALVEPIYPKGGKGRKPIGVETMLRMYYLQIWFGLSAKGTEEAIYDSYAMKQFMSIRFSEEQAPDATTLLRFKKLLADHGLTEQITAIVHDALRQAHKTVRAGSITDAYVVHSPSKRKSAKGGKK